MKAVKIGVISIIAMFLGFDLFAQNMDWHWAKQAGGSSDDYGSAIAVDNSGNSYVTGCFEGTAVFGSTTLNSSGNEDIFVAKMDSNGNWLWAKKAGGSSSDYGSAIAVDNSGNSYVAGRFQSTASFGSTTINSGSTSNFDIFVAKLDSNGNWLWAKKAGGSSSDSGRGIAVDNSGNCYVVGQFKSTASFGSTTLTSSGGIDIFVAKLDSDGNWLWAQKAGGTSSDYGSAIAVDNSGNSYVVGSFWTAASFGSTALISSGPSDFFVAKMDSDGNWLWAQKAGGTSYDACRGIAVDSSGNSYVTGGFNGSVSFGSTTINSGSTSYFDIYVAKMDSNGNWLWAHEAGGFSGGDVSSVAIDDSGNSYVTGFYYGPGSFGSTTLTSDWSNDIFVAKMDSNGNWLWAQNAGGTSSDHGYSIAVDNSGNSYVTGCFEGTAVFGSTTLTSSGSRDIFVAKYGETNLRVLAPNGGEVWKGNSPKTIYWDAAKYPYPINIKLSYNAGESWISLNDDTIAGTLGRWSFSVPILNSAQCLILIESAQFPDEYSDVSDGYFTITTTNPASVTLLTPDSPGLKLQIGREYPLTWSANQVSMIDIDVSNDWGVTWHCIAANLPATPSTYIWAVPDSMPGSNYLRVKDSNNSTTYDWSNDPFTVCNLDFETQPENEVWIENHIMNLSWTSYLVDNIRLQYSTDAEASWHSIVDNTPNTGSYNWQIPKLYSEQCKVRISDADYPSILDDSEGTFTIRPQIVLINPLGGEVIMANSIHRILWDSTDDVAQVVLDYSSNNGSTWSAIQASPYNAALGYYDWLVPAITTDQAKVRIRKYNENNINAISAGVFSIVSDPVAPLAEFNANILSGLEPLEVQFTDLSTPGTGGITAWHWDFGDGGTSSEQNPLYTYNDPGVYSVSLTVEGLFALEHTEVKTDYITVIPSVAEIELLSATALNYGVVYLGDVSPAQTIEVKNTGGAALNIESVSFTAGTSAFSLFDTALPIVLQTDESAVLNVVFTPLANGAVSDSIYIHSDAVNLPVLAIGLRGTGQYVPPAEVATPTVQIVGNDAIISWEAVTETIYGSPITPDLYLVLYNETPYEDQKFLLLSWQHPAYDLYP
jgi:PKD repeat protein